MSRSFEPDGQPLSQNPIMHLFESLVSLATVPGHERVIEDATRIADFIIFQERDIFIGLTQNG